MIQKIKEWLANTKEKREQRLFPERQYLVTISETQITCSRPDGSTESVDISDLEKIEIHTNDLGPYEEDVYWVISGKNSGCVIPQCATGHETLLERLQELPNFDNAELIEAMSCTNNNQFLVWKK